METLLQFWGEYTFFLTQWSANLTYISIAFGIWGAMVVHVFVTRHAALGSRGTSTDYGCPDTRVHKQSGIFGGPAGLTFGIPYFLVMKLLNMEGIVGDYWGGFIYLQFFTSVVQWTLFVFTALFSEKPEKGWRLFKSHKQGCVWISAQSPVGWPFYVVQQMIPEDSAGLVVFIRDLETRILFVLNLPQVIFACILGSMTGTFHIPALMNVDEELPN